MKYLELPLYPSSPTEIIRPADPVTGRPTVWDDEGVPLNSDISDGQLRPSRVEEDYHEAKDLVTWPAEVGKSWTFGALMSRIFNHMPDMLRLAADVNQQTREALGMGTDEPFTLPEGLTIVEGLQKAWSLLMYGHNRLQNGSLPAHIADMQRILPGYEGLLIQQIFKSPLDLIMGNLSNDDLDVGKLKAVMFNPSKNIFINTNNNERCPANKIAQLAMLECMFLPKEEVEAIYGKEWLSKADPTKRLDNLGIAPGAVSLLGIEASRVITNPLDPESARGLLLGHRFLVGDRSPDVMLYVMTNAS